MPEDKNDKQQEIIRMLAFDRPLAHRVIFAHRHKNQTPPFHEQLIDDWHSPEQYISWIVFRGGAKSTIAEEGITLGACFREFKNCLLLGSSADRACERLYAIRHELETNEKLIEIFGSQRGPVWGDDKIETASGVMIQALGTGQALRGVKHLDQRPDFVFADDIETRADARTPEARHKVLTWFMSEVIPACDPSARGRLAATILDPEALPMVLSRPGSGWLTRIIPWEYIDENGNRAPTWPDRFPLEFIDKIKAAFVKSGTLREYRMEYECVASAPEDKPFKGEMMKIEVRPHVWEAAYAMFDPARTTRSTSAMTGYAAWSWLGNRLVVWDAWGKLLMPDEIVSSIFDCDNELHPVLIGVEEDGLNEFLMQPIRQEQIKRGHAIPVKPLRAPKGKLDFIRGLQPFFNAREVTFAKDLPDLRSQLLGFPTGRIDVPNALAYALKLRPGAPMYDSFSAGRHVAEELEVLHTRPAWLCLNATGGLLSGVLVQLIDGNIRVYADYVMEGEPQLILSDMVRMANLEAGRAVRLIAGPRHFETYNNFGVAQAVRKLPGQLERGTAPEMGRPEIKKLLETEQRGLPRFLIASAARWTLNGFASGYCRALTKQGLLSNEAEEGIYRVLMEGLESFAGLLRSGSPEQEDDAIQYAYTADGRRYISARR